MKNKWIIPAVGSIIGLSLIVFLGAVLRLHQLCQRYTWALPVRLICGEPVQVEPTPAPGTGRGCGMPCDDALGYSCDPGLACTHHICLGESCELGCGSSCSDSSQCAAGLSCIPDTLSPASSGAFGQCGGATCDFISRCNETPDDLCDPACEVGRLEANRQTLLCGESGGYRCCTTNLDGGRGTGCFLARDPDCDASLTPPSEPCVSGDGACNPFCEHDRLEVNRYTLDCGIVDGIYQCCMPSGGTTPTCFAAWDHDCDITAQCDQPCRTQADCPAPLSCAIDPYTGSVAVCNNRDMCGPERICTCDGPSLVCPTFTSIAVAECAIPGGYCTCSGRTLACPGLGFAPNPNHPNCYAPAEGCGCNGPDRVCTFGSEVRISQANAPECGAARLMGCYALCDPAAPSCDPGLTCTATEDGLNRCMGGVDATGSDCTTWPSLRGCGTQCNPDAPTCDPGLRCLYSGVENFYRCTGGVDASGFDCTLPPGSGGAPDEPTPTAIPPGGASCGNGVCDPGEHVYNCPVDCGQPPPPATQDPCASAYCGNGVCEYACGETSSNCGDCFY